MADVAERPLPAPVLRVDNVQVRYRNGALGVLDVSLEVGRGEVVALFGPNGAGKTTVVRAASGFLKSEGARVVAGTVTLFGHDVTNLEPYRMTRLGVALVPERRKVFPNMSVMENLTALGTRPPRDRRRRVYDEVFRLFPILAERRRQLAGRLSGGQRQMLAIGRALVSEPKLLVIDEMTLGLHHSLHEPLFDAVERIAATGTAVVLVDESTGFALQAAQYCYLVNAGRVRAHGPASDFRGNELLAAGYVESGGT